MTESPDTAPSTDIVRADERFADADLASVQSFTDAMRLLKDSGLVAESFSESYGTGFKVLDTKDKNRLVGVDFVILEWQFNVGENGGFVSAAIVTTTGEKLVLNDGSSGVYEQLKNVTETRLSGGMGSSAAFKGLAVEGGLRMSEYKTREDGTPLTREELRDHPELAKATGRTFYLAN